MKQNLANDVKVYLIELVRSRPVLYSKAHKDFKDSRTIKRNNWEDVAREMTTEHPTTCSHWKGKIICSLMAPGSMAFLIIHIWRVIRGTKFQWPTI